MTIKQFFVTVICCFSLYSLGQKSQRIAYIDMEYILSQIPGYQKAQDHILQRTQDWRSEISIAYKTLQEMQQQLSTDEPLLTPSLIAMRRAAIKEKKYQITKTEEQYFGATGQLFQMRRQLIRPIQDQVFNAVQILVQRKKYDFIFDKSGEMTVLYANPKYDVSRLVLSYIKKSLKDIAIMEKRAAAKEATAKRKARIEAIKKKRNLK